MYPGEKYVFDSLNNACVPICEDKSDETGEMHFNSGTKKCQRTCDDTNPGAYIPW
jgi:hypothetical protein